MTDPRQRFSFVGLAGGTALALALVAGPANLTVDDGQIGIGQATALAKGNGGGNNGGGHGGGKDKGDRGGGRANSGNSPNFVPGNGSSQAKAAAKAGYNAALATVVPKHAHAAGKDEEVGNATYQFTDAEAEALIKQGWGARKQALDDGFRNHGERVNFYKDLAEALGLPNHFGPMWANFGDPAENGVLTLQAELSAAQNDEETAEIQAELDAAIDRAKPGNGPKSGWETVDADLNDDGIIDRQDLEIALAAGENTAE